MYSLFFSLEAIMNHRLDRLSRTKFLSLIELQLLGTTFAKNLNPFIENLFTNTVFEFIAINILKSNVITLQVYSCKYFILFIN